MDSKKKAFLALGLLIFSIGVLLGMALFGSAVWGDLEGSLFDMSLRGEASLRTLRCPVIMTTAEDGTLTATFTNPLDRSIEYRIQTRVSQGHVTMMREVETRLPLDPGEKETLEWMVTPDDAAYGHLVLVGMRLGAKYPLPARHGTCGILVLNLPNLTGDQVFTFTLLISLVSMAVGIGLWIAGNRPLSVLGRDVTRAMIALAVCVITGMITGFLGWWLIGVIFFAITLLLIGTIMGYFLKAR